MTPIKPAARFLMCRPEHFAVSYAINRQFIVDNVWFKSGKPATGPISSNFTVAGFYSPDVKRYAVPNRVEVANKLLDEAGMKRGPNGVRFEIVHDVTPYGEEWRRFGEAVQHFSLLTIGDGLCAQIPALLISVATGILVTRSASEQDLGSDVAGQILEQRKAPLVAGVVIMAFAAVPALPKIPFLVIGGLFFAVGWSLRKQPTKAEREAAAKAAPNGAHPPELPAAAPPERLHKPEHVLALVEASDMEVARRVAVPADERS